MFILLLLLSILLAWLYPNIGVPNAWFSPSEVAGWGVSVIFFFYGLKLSPAKLRVGLSNIKLHVVVQLSTFVLFPLLVLGTMMVVPSWQNNYYIWLGVYFVATLPSTVSSSVVMVSIARGNIPAAIFNASISSLLGVVLTPLMMSIFVSADTGGNALEDVILKLILQVILPVGAGMLLNHRFGATADRHKTMLRWFDQSVIIAIVYTAFCEGFYSGIFSSVSTWTLLVLTLGMTALFMICYYIILGICNIMKFNREDRIVALFCGSKKSLVHGTVMSKVIVSDPSLISIILLPIMIYHAMQLIIVSFIAKQMSK